NLAAAVGPGSLTVSNNTRPYTITGSGYIAGAGSLIKAGANTLILANQGVDTIGTVLINAGTLQIGTNDLNGSISAVNITNNGSLIVNRSGSLTLSSPIGGSGTLTKNGNGTLILSGANTYAGATTLNAGTLQIDGSISGAGALTTAAGSILSGSGSVNGAVTVAGTLNPGTVGGMGTFTANNGMTLTANCALGFDLNAANPSAGDLVNITGNLTANNNVITVNFNGPPSGGSYPLFAYTGSLIGKFNPVVLGTHFQVQINTNNPGMVYLDVLSGSGSDLSWASTTDANWDQVGVNWLDLTSTLPSTFNTGDTVVFDDTPGVVTSITIPSGVNVTPASLTVTATNNSFTIGGAGRITGNTGLTLSGPSILTVSTPNTFSGPVDVKAGVLRTGNGAALGNTTAGTTVEDGATLDINGQNLGGEVITIAGAGFNNSGALVNNGGGQPQVMRQLILAADATVGGSGLFGINNSGGTASLTGAYNLTKIGGNQLTLQNLSSVDAGLKNIDIQQGIVEFSGLTPSMGDPSYTNIVESGAEVSFSANSVAWNKNFDLTGNGSSTTVNNGTSATTELDGAVVLHGVVVFNVGGTSLTLTNAISGDGGLIKNGGSPLIFAGPTTYTGNTTLNSAALRLNGSADLSGSTNLTINSGSTLTVTGMVNGTFILLNGHNLSGNGVVNGKLTTAAGSTLSPGVNSIGQLTVSNNVVLGGTNAFDLDPDNGTNDVLKSGGSITLGGQLMLTDLSSALTNGSSFKLFNAASYAGGFNTIIPATPGVGLTWNTNALLTSGIISVLGTATAQPVHITSIGLSGTTLSLTATNGLAGGQFVLLASTNLAKPFNQWTPLLTNTFNGSGNVNLSTNILSAGLRQQFFLLVQ
ncbi:MAG TPA: autotransporter-associated beta strand repeat-containing protein, partial [Verrucomicrobiae bacterium]